MNELKEKIGNIGSGTISVCTKPDSKYFLLREEILKATPFLPIETTIGDRIYYIKNDLTSIKLCGCGCGMPVKNPKHIAIFGHSNRMSTVKENKKKSMMEKYNVENPSQLQEIKNKKEQTCLNHFGTKHHMKNDEFKEKFKQMTLDKFGVENVFQLDEVKEQIKATFIEHYGVDHPMKAEVNVEKLKQTMLDRFGVDSPIKNEQIKEKIKQTNLDRLGVSTPFESKEVLDKCKQTFLENYGDECIYRASEIKNKMMLNSKKAFYENLLSGNRLSQKVIPLFTFEEFSHVSAKYKFKCCECNNVFDSDLDDGKVPRCLVCYPYLKGQSQAEIDLVNFIKTFYKVQILTNCRKVLNDNMELDIYLPEKKLAIEVNGIYWHSELNGNKTKDYHLKKTLECETKGIRLIHVFEDELMNKQSIVYSRIKHIIGFANYKLGARKCEVKEIDSKLCNKFLNKYHIQGKDHSGIRLGLFYKNRLVAVMTFCKNRVALGRAHVEGEFELSRFATISSFNIMGAGDKLLKHFERNFKPIKLLSYADRRWSVGVVYFKLGFQLTHISKPNYWYVKNGQREHRFKYRKDVLLKEGFDASLTEWQIMQEKGYDRIWDCGNYVFVKEL